MLNTSWPTQKQLTVTPNTQILSFSPSASCPSLNTSGLGPQTTLSRHSGYQSANLC